jgi:hypothetical protein
VAKPSNKTRTRIDRLFAGMAEEWAETQRRPAGRKKVEAKPTGPRRGSRNRPLPDWDNDALTLTIEARLHLHDPPPLGQWRQQTPTDIARAALGLEKVDRGMAIRVGRAMTRLAEKHPAVSRVWHCGRPQYLVPVVGPASESRG